VYNIKRRGRRAIGEPSLQGRTGATMDQNRSHDARTEGESRILITPGEADATSMVRGELLLAGAAFPADGGSKEGLKEDGWGVKGNEIETDAQDCRSRLSQWSWVRLDTTWPRQGKCSAHRRVATEGSQQEWGGGTLVTRGPARLRMPAIPSELG
jgi:hypothetical protein